MYKLICNQNECDNNAIPYYFSEIQDFTICGGCKAALVPIVMTEAEITNIFDYDYNAKPIREQSTPNLPGGNNDTNEL